MGKINFSLGQRIIAKAPCFCFPYERTAPLGGGDIAVTAADILAAVEAKSGLTPPTGTAFQLQNVSVATYSKGTEVTDEVTDVETATAIDDSNIVTCGGQDYNVNPYGGNKPFGNDVYDADCDGESDNLLPADFEVTIKDGSAVAFYACITPVTTA